MGKFGDQLTFIDMTIGDYTVIGRHCVIRAWQIGCCCWIGEGSVINNKCVVEDCGMVMENTVLAPGTVVPPYTVFAGNPGRCIGRLPPTFDMIMNEHTHAFYAAFKPERSANPRSRGGSRRDRGDRGDRQRRDGDRRRPDRGSSRRDGGGSSRPRPDASKTSLQPTKPATGAPTKAE